MVKMGEREVELLSYLERIKTTAGLKQQAAINMPINGVLNQYFLESHR